MFIPLWFYEISSHIHFLSISDRSEYNILLCYYCYCLLLFCEKKVLPYLSLDYMKLLLLRSFYKIHFVSSCFAQSYHYRNFQVYFFIIFHYNHCVESHFYTTNTWSSLCWSSDQLFPLLFLCHFLEKLLSQVYMLIRLFNWKKRWV